MDVIRNDGSAVVFSWCGRPVPSVDQSQRSRLRDRSPEVDICVSVPAAALRHIRRVLLCARVAHFQDVLRAQTARPARARHPATGEPPSSDGACVHRCVRVQSDAPRSLIQKR